jgi:hypothetical protein
MRTVRQMHDAQKHILTKNSNDRQKKYSANISASEASKWNSPRRLREHKFLKSAAIRSRGAWGPTVKMNTLMYEAITHVWSRDVYVQCQWANS